MTAYIIRRLLLVIPTLIGIMTVNFVIIQIAPGGPVEQMIAKLQGEAVSATERLSGGGEDVKGQKKAKSLIISLPSKLSRLLPKNDCIYYPPFAARYSYVIWNNDCELRYYPVRSWRSCGANDWNAAG